MIEIPLNRGYCVYDSSEILVCFCIGPHCNAELLQEQQLLQEQWLRRQQLQLHHQLCCPTVMQICYVVSATTSSMPKRLNAVTSMFAFSLCALSRFNVKIEREIYPFYFTILPFKPTSTILPISPQLLSLTMTLRLF